MKKNGAFRRAAALLAALSITVSLAAPAFAGTYYIDDGDITITKDEYGKQTVQQGSNAAGKIGDDEEIIITTHKKAITSLESDLEGPAAEDSGFGPVVEDNYQPAAPAQPEDAEEPKDADQPEDAKEPKAADRQESADQQPQQAAPTAAPASPSVNDKGNGFFGNTITVINNFVNTALKLTLKDVKIDMSTPGEEGSGVAGKAALSVEGKGNVEIELDGNNELKSGASKAGLEKTSTGKLTLKDDNNEAGSLTATGGASAAGIGGGFQGKGENITITGGTVTAAGGDFGAGIGGSNGGSGNNITIKGGTVTATGGEGGAGIGGGAEGGGGNNITIKGSTVTATGGGYRGNSGAGIGGGSSGSGENITINDGKVTATGGNYAAGIGGGSGKNITINGEDITINGGKVNASGAYGGAGIGGGVNGIGSKVTVSGAAQVTATATGSGPDWSGVGTGATIGNGGSKTPDGPVDGKEIQADISHLTTGYIHHIIYNPDLDSDGKPDGILKEWWEFALPKPIPDGESLDLHVETLKGAPLLFNTRQQGSTLRVTSNTLAARLHGTRQALETLQEQGGGADPVCYHPQNDHPVGGRPAGRGGQLVCSGARRPWEPAAERSSSREPEVPDALKNTDPLQGPPWGITRGGLFFVS